MRVLVQRVKEASVSIEGGRTASVGKGLLLFLGIEAIDDMTDVDWLVGKLINMRIFPDAEGKMNLNALDIQGEFLVISQFTLHASTKKGNRPSFIKAARPETAIPLYEKFLESLLKSVSAKVESGVFGADMQISLVNDGPVTIFIDSRARE